MPDKRKIDGAAISRYITSHRRALGLSRRDAETRAKVSPMTWTQLEAGKSLAPRDVTLLRVAKALERDPAELFKLYGREYSAIPAERPRVLESLDADSSLSTSDRTLLAQLYERLRS